MRRWLLWHVGHLSHFGRRLKWARDQDEDPSGDLFSLAERSLSESPFLRMGRVLATRIPTYAECSPQIDEDPHLVVCCYVKVPIVKTRFSGHGSYE